LAGQTGTENCPKPIDQSLWVGFFDFRPIDQNKSERPRSQNPTDRSAHAHDAELLLRIFHVRKGNRVRDGNGRHVKQAMDHHQAEERPKFASECEAENGESANQMAECEKFFCRKISVRELVAEKHSDDGGDGKRIQNQGRLSRCETDSGQIAEDQWQPRAPDEKFQHHHEEKFETNGLIHGREIRGTRNLRQAILDARRSVNYRSVVRIAFKEWAVIVDALGRGEQILILRKGGISEGRSGFQVEHPEFLFFPTLFHQQRESVLPAAQKRFDEISKNFPLPEILRLEFFAKVVDWQELGSLAEAERLRGQHIWRDEVIAERFDWGKSKNIFAMAVRVFRLPKSIELPNLPSYGGCKSWIELEREIALDDSKPVLADELFTEKLAHFQKSLVLTPGQNCGTY